MNDLTETTTHHDDWSACELSTTDLLSLDPVQEAERILAIASRDIQAREVERLRALVGSLVPTDEASLQRCGLFIEQCKLATRDTENKRLRVVEPLNQQVHAINDLYNPVRDVFRELGRVATGHANRYLEEQRKAVEREQQRINALAAAKQAELDRKAAEARAEAERLAQEGNTGKAAKLEAKAAQLEQRAAETLPDQVLTVPSTVEVGTGTLSFKGPKKTWALAGWDKKKPLPLKDPALAPLLGDISKLPEGVQFLLQHADLNPVRLNATYKGGGAFPAPFTEIADYSGSVLRG